MPDQIPEYGDTAQMPTGQTNLLIAGKHGSLVDTMIFTNVNYDKKRITLVSIPRDLYYNGRKINSYYALFGMEELKRTLTKITGYQIDKYILIDMYAFIDVVDLIGGIEVHLDKPVIDPTYKTLDGEQWSTLYYRAGDHHLSGKQALRLARTRHTSSDFARAERQQMILKAMQQKARGLGLGDAQKITSIATAVLGRTETDFNLGDALAAYFRYQGFEIDSGHVISSGNILESKNSNEGQNNECLAKLDASKKKAETDGQPMNADDVKKKQAACTADKGAYILLPRGGNWNVIKWYFRNLLDK